MRSGGMLLPQDVIHAYLGITVAIAGYENRGYVNHCRWRSRNNYALRVWAWQYSAHTYAGVRVCAVQDARISERGSFEPGLLRRKKALFRAYSAADWSYRAAECN